MTKPISQPIALPAERYWAYSDLLYGALIAWLSWRFIPIDTSRLPYIPKTLIVWGSSHILIGLLALFSSYRSQSTALRLWTWRSNLAISIFTIVIGVLFTTFCLMSGLYWLGVFGVLGWGVFISSLLLISGIIQCLILYPSLKLKRLLSDEYRSIFKGGGVPLLVLKLSLLLGVIGGGLGAYHGGMSTQSHLSHQQRDLITQYLRSTLEGAPHTPAAEQVGASGVVNRTLSSSSSTSRPLSALKHIPQEDLLFVSFYAGGRRLVRVGGRGSNLAQATRDAASALAGHPKLIGKRLRGGRLVVDRVIGESRIPLTSIPTLGEAMIALSVDPGVDGLRGRRGGATRTILPSDLVEKERFGVAPIVPGIPELRFGVDARALLKRLGDLKRTTILRIRTEQWVERVELDSPKQAQTLESVTSNARLTALTTRGQWGKSLSLEDNPQERLHQRRAAYLDAAHLGGDYLVNHQGLDGRFDYQYFPYRDEVKQPSDARYSVPRHAGAIYGLAMLYKSRPKVEYKQAAKRAIKWLTRYTLTECGGWRPPMTCIPKINTKDQTASLGHSALSALAILTYIQITQDPSVIPMAHGLVEFLAHMQRADGDFHHRYLIYDDSVEPRDRGMFASEQATFAMVLAHRQWPDEGWGVRAERALDALTVHKYEGDFLSSFFYGADHWTCLAAHAAYPAIKKRSYLDFCLGYARFLQRLQYRSDHGEGDVAYHGHYGFGFLSPPQAPATGGFTEGVMGALLLAEAHQLPSETLKDLYGQVLASTEALVNDQITHDNRWPFPNFHRARGAFRRSVVESEVRVDFVQHSLSALLMTQALK